jgi:hypothetical protein
VRRSVPRLALALVLVPGLLLESSATPALPPALPPVRRWARVLAQPRLSSRAPGRV